MKKIHKSIVLVIVFLACMAGVAWGEDYCVSTTKELQDALTDAQTNGEDDIIRIVRGTYNGSFIYQSNEGYSIALLGGYGTNSAPYLPSNDLDGNQRILDGNGDGISAVDMGAYEIVGVLPIFHGHDFDGNGSSDVSVYRPTNGRWYIKGLAGSIWGTAGDIPVVR